MAEGIPLRIKGDEKSEYTGGQSDLGTVVN